MVAAFKAVLVAIMIVAAAGAVICLVAVALIDLGNLIHRFASRWNRNRDNDTP